MSKTLLGTNMWVEPLAVPPLWQGRILVVSLPASRQSLPASTDRRHVCALLPSLHHLMAFLLFHRLGKKAFPMLPGSVKDRELP